MSRVFGAIRQIAFVVADLDAAITHWTSALGIGPFFVRRRVTPESFRYRGVASPAPCISIALANSGDVQVELVEQHDDRPSGWRERLVRSHDGLQHVASWLTRAEYDATYERASSNGAIVVHEGVLPSTGVRFAYFTIGTEASELMFEIADIAEPQAYARMQRIAEAARGWDGRDPVRELVVAR